jgi:tRNA-guanine family transglycosylase
MRYFVSWTHSDPIYQEHLPEVRALISPPNVALAWQARNWAISPAELIVDSGAYQHQRSGRSPEPVEALQRQLHIAEGLDIPVGVCHLDALTTGAGTLTERERRVARNLVQARWLIDQVAVAEIPARITPIGVIQGVGPEQVYYVGRALAEMGYERFALGSLAALAGGARAEILRRAEAALEAVGPRLHVLGVSSAALLADLARSGVESADSSAPMHEAARGGVIYSQPFRRYKLASAHFAEWRRSYGLADLLEAPLPCGCPVCREDPVRLLEPHGKRAVNLRGIHNYYHLRRAIEGV